ncbi:D-Ala-D-Ala carboxypeptidase family metallohydrolase [Algiphilus sp.]|uniref:D-Ala-D-Ala carboxypeptidase family metallohydrolase n=1 Tax=Algiphilus sp. TaxID=1872431 RepID=UPI0025BF5C4F|nr:D-Ala-D-Ala carboxypeptidase family metallohydrolase [Algiphilus sp.]MCK5772012.1 hypothetical protein [Algiphilus sp.]
MRLSRNFALEEFERSQTAARRGVNNAVPGDLLPNLQRLVDQVLQPLRDEFGPVQITSGYRCPALNRYVGGSPRSQHMQALAADLVIVDHEPVEICEWIAGSSLPFDQLIHEFGRWTHVSVAAAGDVPRRQLLTIDRHGTRAGLHAARL